MAEVGGRERVFNDERGLIVFECDPQPAFARIDLHGVVVRHKESWQRALRAAIVEEPLSAQYRLAYDIYSASFFVKTSADARFIMLMMALETLIEQERREEVVQNHVDALIRITRDSGLTRNEVESIVGSLEWLRVESVTKAGRRLAGTLEGRLYGGHSPGRFFVTCYDLRSRLVHGYYPRPSREEVGVLAANLENMVGHLIAGPRVVEATFRS